MLVEHAVRMQLTSYVFIFISDSLNKFFYEKVQPVFIKIYFFSLFHYFHVFIFESRVLIIRTCTYSTALYEQSFFVLYILSSAYPQISIAFWKCLRPILAHKSAQNPIYTFGIDSNLCKKSYYGFCVAF